MESEHKIMTDEEIEAQIQRDMIAIRLSDSERSRQNGLGIYRIHMG